MPPMEEKTNETATTSASPTSDPAVAMAAVATAAAAASSAPAARKNPTNGIPAATEQLPDWAIPFVPADLRTARGTPLVAVLCKGERCSVNRGDRVVLISELSDGDEKFAIMRAAGDPNRVMTELSKQQIRAIDGHVADFSGVPTALGSVDAFWTECGPKHRALFQRIYTRINQMTNEELADFFDNCIAVKIG